MTKEERESYECFLERISMPPCLVPVPKAEQDEYNRTHPLPTQEEINKVLKDAGYCSPPDEEPENCIIMA